MTHGYIRSIIQLKYNTLPEVNMLDVTEITVDEIWNYLVGHDASYIGKETKELNKTERMIPAGIQWLAREGELSTIQRQRSTYFMLNDSSTANGGNNL